MQINGTYHEFEPLKLTLEETFSPVWAKKSRLTCSFVVLSGKKIRGAEMCASARFAKSGRSYYTDYINTSPSLKLQLKLALIFTIDHKFTEQYK